MARLGRAQPVNVVYSDDAISIPNLTAGQGTAAATGTGRLIADLKSHADAAAASPTALLNLAVSLAGTGAATAGSTGFLIESARLAGTGTGAAGSQAPLTGIGGHVDLSGNGTAAAGSAAPFVLAVDLTARGNAATTGTAPLTVGPPVLGYVAWYDATDPATITSVGHVVSGWADKSGHGYNLAQVTDFKRPSTGLRTILSNNVISFGQIPNDQGLVFAGLPLNDAVITVFVAAQFTSGNRLFSFNDGVQSDWDNTSGLAVLSFADDSSFYDFTRIPPTGAGFGTSAFVYDIRRDGSNWTANIDGVALPGNTTVDTTFNAIDIGVGGIPFPPDVAAGATGLVGEILVYAEALDPGEVTAIEAYLISKWLVRTATLSGGHGDAAASATIDLTVIPQHLVFIDGHGDTSDGTNTTDLPLVSDLSGHGDASSSATVELRVLGAVALTGHGDAAASAGSSRAVLAASLTGHGDAASAGSGIQIAQLIGHGDSSNTGTFDLLVRAQVDLTGHGDAVTAGTAAVRLAAALAGTGTAASAVTSLVVLTLALAGKGTAAASARTTLFGAVQDPDAANLTILDDHHTDTIWDRGHTVTLVDS